jgi:hypothetical protein
VTAQQLKEAHDADLAIEKDEGVHFERAWLDPSSGKVFCLSSARAARASCESTSVPVIRRPRSTSCRSRSEAPGQSDRSVAGRSLAGRSLAAA